jgi:hypothetical protein
MVKVNTYNHPTVAYRTRRDIIFGFNPVFPVGEYQATVIKDEKSRFIAPISRRWTYKYDLFMMYTPKTPQGDN